jgi:hypothetical protein
MKTLECCRDSRAAAQQLTVWNATRTVRAWAGSLSGGRAAVPCAACVVSEEPEPFRFNIYTHHDRRVGTTLPHRTSTFTSSSSFMR